MSKTYFLVGEFLILEMAPKLLACNSNFLATLVTSGDSGLSSFLKSSDEDLTEVVITSDPSNLDVTTNMGMDLTLEALGRLPASSGQAAPPPSERVGLGGSYCLALLIGLPGSEDGRSESFQRPDCNELQRFFMYGAHLSIIKYSLHFWYFRPQ